MSPLEFTDWRLAFESPVSPWWLVLILPALTWLVWRTYRSELAEQPRWVRFTLRSMRIGLVLAVAVLLLRPALYLTRTWVYPARVLYVIDDSQSMSVKDSRLPGPAALYVHRQLQDPGASELDTFHRLREIAADRARAIRRFAAFTRTVDRRQDAFWTESTRVKAHVQGGFDSFESLAFAAVSTGTEATAEAARELLNRMDRLADDRGVLFEGQHDPGQEAYTRFADELSAIADRAGTVQAETDVARLAEGNEALRRQVDAIREAGRFDLVKQVLSRTRSGQPASASRPYHRWVRLSDGARGPLDEFTGSSVSPDAPHTDILGRLRALVEEDSPFPLAAIVLLSDGADLSDRPGREVQRLLSERQVPVLCAAVGAREEPYDLAVSGVSAPSFAVAGEPTTVAIELKTLLPAPAQIRIAIRHGKTVLAERDVTVGESTQQRETLTFSPDSAGIVRCTVEAGVLKGEAVGGENNRSEFVLHVRDRRLRVLYLDARPNWDVRFALDALQRLPGADVDKLVVSMLPGGMLKRGPGLGAFPNDLASLRQCDLIILASLRPGMLTNRGEASDWAMLEEYVKEGGALCFFDASAKALIPEGCELAGVLEPLVPLGDPAELLSDTPAGVEGEGENKDIRSLQSLLLLGDGYYHPITQALSSQLPVTRRPLLKHGSDATRTLVMTRNFEPLVRTARLGKGHVVLLAAGRLWAVLDATLSEAHARMFPALVQTAVEGQLTREADDRPQLALDIRRTREGAPLQVQVIPPDVGRTVEAIRAGEIVARSPVRTSAGSDRGTADFASLPPGDVVFRLEGNPDTATGPLRVVHTGRELVQLARNDPFLDELAQFTGGRKAELVDLPRLLESVHAAPRRETHERVWRIGGSAWVLVALMLLFTIELVTRKIVGMT